MHTVTSAKFRANQQGLLKLNRHVNQSFEVDPNDEYVLD
jgi:hypothetical protein